LDNGRLEGRVAVVTGASSGIGEATARRFAACGAAVALLARRADRLQRLVEDLGRDRGHEVRAYEVDVRDRDGLGRAAEAVQRDLGRVDCLVNNAGVMLLSRFQTGLEDEWQAMVETNLLGVLSTTAAFLDQLTDGGGDIVNVSSVGGRKARPTGSVYSATKWGLNGWSEGLRQELLEHDVRVIVIEPGATVSELASHTTDAEGRASTSRARATFEILQADDIARVIAFAIALPPRVALNEVLVRPTRQPF
jgi:NADP-dependent 3-hydroxy acid dehydrogenase YdfG